MSWNFFNTPRILSIVRILGRGGSDTFVVSLSCVVRPRGVQIKIKILRFCTPPPLYEVRSTSISFPLISIYQNEILFYNKTICSFYIRTIKLNTLFPSMNQAIDAWSLSLFISCLKMQYLPLQQCRIEYLEGFLLAYWINKNRKVPDQEKSRMGQYLPISLLQDIDDFTFAMWWYIVMVKNHIVQKLWAFLPYCWARLII